jgi:co-chaperonin GroES (HSP10)
MPDERVEKVGDFKVVGNKILIRLDERIEKIGGLYVAEGSKKQIPAGEILEIGSEVDVNFYPVKVGNIIKVGAFTGWDVKFKDDKREYKLIHPDDVLMVKIQEGNK